MKLTFPLHNDGLYHQYCFECHSESVERIYENTRTYYRCTTCQKISERSIVIDPAVKWWIDDSDEYWHESSGVFVRNPKGEFLFFERTIFPFAYTVPSGHVDADENPEVSAHRELMEEVGLSGKLHHIATQDIVGDSCRRGSDAHRWHAYSLLLSSPVDVSVKEEGDTAVWLTLDQALQKPLTYPVKQVITRFKNELTRDSTSDTISP